MPPKSMSKDGGGQGQAVDLNSLTTQQLMQVKKQLDDELEHLNNSFNSLRGAQTRFSECYKSIDAGVANIAEGKGILVPLTTSLYVPGTLASRDKVLVDVGTGYFVEKSIADAKKFYEAKTKELGQNLKDLEGVLQGKANNLRVVEEGWCRICFLSVKLFVHSHELTLFQYFVRKWSLDRTATRRLKLLHLSVPFGHESLLRHRGHHSRFIPLVTSSL